MEVSDKNIYEYIVNLAEDRDVINMLSVNRKFNDDSYFKKILEKRYPLLLRFKREAETYRQFYLKMVKYIAKMWEEYQIPYIPSEYFNPYAMYINYDNPGIYTISLFKAVEIDDIKLAQYLIEKGGEIKKETYEYATTVEMLKFLLNKLAPSYAILQDLLERAKQNNNTPIIDFLEEAGIH